MSATLTEPAPQPPSAPPSSAVTRKSAARRRSQPRGPGPGDLISALIVGGIVIIFSDPDTLDTWNSFFSDPAEALRTSWDTMSDAYRALFETSLGSASAISRTLAEATPLLFAGLSVALAFRAGLFNIGGAGQLMMGATAAAYVGITFDLPKIIHLPLALAAGALGGAVWGGIAGFLKARTGAHEVITTIMLNYIALRLLDYALLDRDVPPPGAQRPHHPRDARVGAAPRPSRSVSSPSGWASSWPSSLQ